LITNEKLKSICRRTDKEEAETTKNLRPLNFYETGFFISLTRCQKFDKKVLALFAKNRG